MKYLTFVFILLFSPIFVFAQEDSTDYQNEEIELIMVIEKMPEFPGGEQARLKYLSNNITYTEKAKKDGVRGTVYVTFIVEKSGEVSNARVLRGIHPDLDSIALKIINNMPNWSPATIRGKPLDCQFNMPIKFNFQGQGTPETPIPSKYWAKKGKRKFYKACKEEYKMTQEECDCWYHYIIWNYNGLKLEYIDLDYLFRTQTCN